MIFLLYGKESVSKNRQSHGCTFIVYLFKNMNNETAPTDRGMSELAVYKFGIRSVGAKGYEGIDKVQLTSSFSLIFVHSLRSQHCPASSN